MKRLIQKCGFCLSVSLLKNYKKKRSLSETISYDRQPHVSIYKLRSPSEKLRHLTLNKVTSGYSDLIKM